VIDEDRELRNEENGWALAAQAGDEMAFTNLIERYERAVYNLCYRMLGNPGEAEDAAQEAFLRAYRAIKRFDPERKFSTWVMSIASNYCIDQLRKRRLFTLSLDEMPYLDVSDSAPGPEGRLVKGEFESEIREILGSLGEMDRAAVIMRYWHELSYDEIAEALDLTNSAVKSRLHRARRTLADAWDARSDTPVPAQGTMPGAEVHGTLFGADEHVTLYGSQTV
jgi:RNA polymerase sigma-70 factor (ECF subfamily)